MTRRLPPLNALRAFEAAARNGSFVRAGEELHVTAGAVSQQVKSLEGWLGIRLFRRLHRGLSLTPEGRAYQLRLGRALDEMADATTVLKGRSDLPLLTISALPALAEKWLMPRLGGFKESHPGIDVRLEAEERLVDLEREGIDIGLRYSDGDSAGLRLEPLFREQIFPACSPALLNGPTPLRHPADLAGHTLLQDTHWRQDWRLWLAAAGVTDLDPGRGPSFTLYSMAVQAAVEGLGVLMAHSALVAEELASGRLVEPFDLRLPAPHAYAVVSLAETADRPAIAAFRSWIVAVAKAFASPV